MDKLIVGNDHCKIMHVRDAMCRGYLSAGYLASDLKWIDLANRLGLKPETTEKLKMSWETKKIGFEEVIRKILLEWRGMNGSGARLTRLITALEQVGARGTADELRKMFESELPSEQ